MNRFILIVTKVFLLKAFETLVFSCGKPCPGVVDDVSEGRIPGAFLYAMGLPLVSKVLADLDTFEALVNPVVRISQTFVVLQGLLDSQFWILHLVDSLRTNECEPPLKWLCLLGGNGLDNAENALQIHASYSMRLPIGRDETVSGTI